MVRYFAANKKITKNGLGELRFFYNWQILLIHNNRV